LGAAPGALLLPDGDVTSGEGGNEDGETDAVAVNSGWQTVEVSAGVVDPFGRGHRKVAVDQADGRRPADDGRIGGFDHGSGHDQGLATELGAASLEIAFGPLGLAAVVSFTLPTATPRAG
jgi:hypothetical protein